jgi:hypothetical protein
MVLVVVGVREVGLQSGDEGAVQLTCVGGGSVARLLHERVGVIENTLEVYEQASEAETS